MYIKIICIIVVIVLAIIKLIKQYLIEQNICPNKIEKIDKQIDDFINKHYKKILIILIILVAFSRFYKFGVYPNFIGVDEAGAAYDAYCLANYGVDRYLNSYPLYLINFGGGQSILYAYVTIPFIKILGANIISYRLPELLFYLMSILVCFFLVKKIKNKKIAVLYSFLIITCPWHIEASRKGLDCNLLAPMFMLDLYVLLNAKKNWHYILSGIFIGITLYTYCLSWLLIPSFLIIYICYMLYLKKITFKQIILLGIPIFIFAIPLFYLLLLNSGYATQTDFGIFTIPKLPFFRTGEIRLTNLIKWYKFSLSTIFSEDVFYFIEIPLFIIGYIIGIKKFIRSFKKKEFDFDGFIILIFTVLILVNMLVIIEANNRANILYLPMLYIITNGVLYLCKGSYVNTLIILLSITILFINYEITYFSQKEESKMIIYNDSKIMGITRELESLPNSLEIEKYIIMPKVQAHIYTLLENKLSPYELEKTKKTGSKLIELHIIESYGTYHFVYGENFKEKLDNTYKNKKYIFVIDNIYVESIDYLKQLDFYIENRGSYSVIKNF